ncbi:SpoIIE family protein phosphatase [Streptomyces sp. NPDC056296]|uniref:SpoIIE family protein phosphatase n=1 Tax=Streptomyces sp. NPDC056296 TaxID=3345775 RepID=UPI0035DFF4F0
MIDAEETVVGWSQAASELLDRTGDDVLGRPFESLLAAPPTGQISRGAAAPMWHGSGEPVDVNFLAVPLQGLPYRLVLITATELAHEVELGTSLYRALLAQDQIGFVVRDNDLLVVQANANAWKHFLPAGSSLKEAMNPEDAAAAEAALRTVLRTGLPQAAHEQHVRSLTEPDAEWSLSVSAVRLTDRMSSPLGVAVLLTDATAQWLANRRLRLHHAAAVNVGHSLDVTQTAEDIAELLVPDFGTMASVDLAEAVLEGDEPPKSHSGEGDLHLRRAAVRSAGGAWPSALLQPGDRIPRLPTTQGIRRLLEGRTVITDRAALEQALADPSVIPLIIPDSGRSLAIAPMVGRGMVLGVIAVWRTEGVAPFTEEDAGLLSEIAAHAALSVDNARRYLREHRASVVLQRRLLPKGSITTTTVDTAGVYQPAGGGADIGGDWFDAIPLPSLRVAMVVGDVTGHGLHSAATMGRLRTAVQTLADLELAPDEILTRLDELVTRLAAEADPEHRDMIGATCLLAVYDPITEQCTLASAGHPPPLLVTPSGDTSPIPLRPGPPLGVGGLPFETATIPLEPGSMLALYTDGLLGYREAEVDVDQAIAHLGARLAEYQLSGTPLGEAARGLISQQAAAADDTALLLSRVKPLEPGAVSHWEFPADPAAVAEARAAVQRKLGDWGLDDIAFTTELVVSELVTNAIRYAGGPVGLRLIRDAVLTCEVSDPSNTQPRLRRARDTDEGGRGLFLVAQLSQRWGSRYGATGKTIWAEQSLSP